MKPQLFLAFLMVALLTSATVAQNGASPREVARKPVRVLLVVAHPDDEYEMAGTVYRIGKELFGTVVYPPTRAIGSWATHRIASAWPERYSG
jgi:hypothetical protein